MALKKIIEFLSRNVDGRTVYTDPLTYRLEDGKLEGVYADQISFCSLQSGESFLSLDMFVVANEKIYRRDKDARRGALVKDFSAVSLFRYELALRQSSGQVTGFFHMISASGKNVPARAVGSAIYGLQLDDAQLTLLEDQMLYRDQSSSDGGFQSVAFSAHTIFSLENDRLTYAYYADYHLVHPQTLARTSSGADYPPFIGVERHAGPPEKHA
jgi:hypothetical protein